jgi:general secretion pathway protein J
MMRAGVATRGFTLLEVLVAVTLLGVLSVALFGAVRVGAQGWRHAEQRSAATADEAAVQDMLRRMIGSAKPVFASTDPTNAAVAFDGGPRALALIGLLPDAFAPGLQGQQRLFLAQFGGTRALMLAWRLDLPAADGAALPETLVPLVDHVRAVRFAYYGPPANGSAPEWTDSWADRTTLPALVRVHLERDAGAPDSWPDLLVSPVATISNECRYTGVDAGCHRTP